MAWQSAQTILLLLPWQISFCICYCNFFFFLPMGNLPLLPWQNYISCHGNFLIFFILPWQYFLLLCHGKFWIHWHGNFHHLFPTTIFSFIEMENLHLLSRQIYFNIHGNILLFGFAMAIFFINWHGKLAFIAMAILV